MGWPYKRRRVLDSDSDVSTKNADIHDGDSSGKRAVDSNADVPTKNDDMHDEDSSGKHVVDSDSGVPVKSDDMDDMDDGDSSWSPAEETKKASAQRKSSAALRKKNAAFGVAKQHNDSSRFAAERALTGNIRISRKKKQKRRFPQSFKREEEEDSDYESSNDSDWRDDSDWREKGFRRSKTPRRWLPARRPQAEQSISSEASDGNPRRKVALQETGLTAVTGASSSSASKQPLVSKILARRPETCAAGPNGTWEYLVLYKGQSYRRRLWVSGQELLEAHPGNARRLQAWPCAQQVLQPEELTALQNGTHEFLTEDRILHAQERRTSPSTRWKYLVKWQGLGYAEATWELEDELDQNLIDDYWQRVNAPPRRVANSLPQQCRRIPTAAAAFDAQLQNSASSEQQHCLVFRPRAPLEIFDFQAAGVRWLLQRWQMRSGGCILADEMGLGKTVQAVLFLGIVARLWKGIGIGAPFLVVSPLSVLAQWRVELAKWAPELRVVTLQGTQEDRSIAAKYEWWQIGDRRRGHDEFPGFDVCLTSYDVLQIALNGNCRGDKKKRRLKNNVAGPRMFTAFPWGICILDECTRMKSVNSKLRQDYARVVLPHVDHHILLTATPIQNDIGELWSLLNLADHRHFANRCAFERQYGEITKQDRVQELQKELGEYLLQRRKLEVLAQMLPKMEEMVINIELTVEQKKLHRAIFEKNVDALLSCTDTAKDGIAGLPSLMNVAMQLRKVCNHPYLLPGTEERITHEMDPASDACFQAFVQSSGKTVVLDKILRKAWNEGERVLVFSQFTMMLDLLEDLLQGRGYPYERLDGKVNVKRRQNAIKRFSAESASSNSGIDSASPHGEADKTKCSTMQVFLISTRAGGLGLNLVAASVCVLFDCDWNPQSDLQAMARCHRIGQNRNVHVYRLITKNTYEAGMFRMASKKLGLTQVLMDFGGPDSYDIASKPSGEVIETLLRQGAFAAFDVEDESACRADERSFDEILQSDDVQVLGPSDENLKKTDVQGPTRFRKMFFGPSSGNIDGHVSVDDPDFWKKIANLCTLKRKKQQKQEEAKKTKMTHRSTVVQTRYRLRFKQSSERLHRVRTCTAEKRS